MTLADAIADYVALRRSRGSPSASTESTLRCFCTSTGPIALQEVSAKTVSHFLDSDIAQVTKCSRFSGVKCFLENCAARGMMPALHLTPPTKPEQLRPPFIFTQAKIREMLQEAEHCQRRAFDLDGRTLRMVVLLLYATGATSDEVLRLRAEDLDKRKRTLHLRGTVSRPARLLPISSELTDEVVSYISSMRVPTQSRKDALLLTSLAGEPLRRGNLCVRFKMLQRFGQAPSSVTASSLIKDGLPPENPQTLPPVTTERRVAGRRGRLQDLRYTFAIHRIKRWIAEGADLAKLLPALSAYMGYASLIKSEDFLAFTPERFHKNLRKLTREKGEPSWTADTGLTDFLCRL